MNVRNTAAQKPGSRPTTLGLALMNAAVRAADGPRCDVAVTIYRTISKNEDEKRPFKSGYNVPVVDRYAMRVASGRIS